MEFTLETERSAERNCVLRELIAATYRVARRRATFTSLDVLNEAGAQTRAFAANSRLVAVALSKCRAARLRYCLPTEGPAQFESPEDALSHKRPRRVWRSLILVTSYPNLLPVTTDATRRAPLGGE